MNIYESSKSSKVNVNFIRYFDVENTHSSMNQSKQFVNFYYTDKVDGWTDGARIKVPQQSLRRGQKRKEIVIHIYCPGQHLSPISLHKNQMVSPPPPTHF